MVDAKLETNRHRELTEEGWERRFTAEDPRLTEMKQLYESMGLEVLVEPGSAEEGQECGRCFDLKGFEGRYKTIFTRCRPSSDNSRSDELFD